MWNRKARIFIAVLTVIFLIVYIVLQNGYVVKHDYNKIEIDQSLTLSSQFVVPEATTSEPSAPETQNKTGSIIDTCILKDLDPWDAEVNKFLDYTYNPYKNCNRTVEMATKLENGKLYVIDQRTNIQCWWQCLYPKDDWHYTPGPWNKLVNGSVPDCDIVETNCRQNRHTDSAQLTPNNSNFKNETYYEFLHTQTYRKDIPEKAETSTLDRPNVHIFVIDSVSHSHFMRAMPKTRHILSKNFDAVAFPYLNKVHLNSLPNAYAFLMGKTQFAAKKSPMSAGFSDDFHGKSSCYNDLSKEKQFIAFQYKEASYETLMSEDYLITVFTPPFCWGFNNTPVDHYMHPYQMRAESKDYKTPLLQKSIYSGMCRNSLVPQLEYLQDLLDKYPDKPKFSITWSTYMTHENINGLFQTDDQFYNFFKDNSKKLNNSYLFVMSDHGLRYGQARQTAAGDKEDYNPFLFMSLPASLRNNSELKSVIQNNTRQLLSQYDVYATLADIVAPYRPPNSSEPILRGSSLLKPLPQPRSCDRLRIPFEYCICDFPKTTLPANDETARQAATVMVEEMNDVLRKRADLKNICTNLSLSSAPIIAESFALEGNSSVYKITFEVSPGDGRFYGHISQDRISKNFTILSRVFPRLNAYAKTAACAKSYHYASYCYCNNLLQKSVAVIREKTESIRQMLGF